MTSNDNRSHGQTTNTESSTRDVGGLVGHSSYPATGGDGRVGSIVPTRPTPTTVRVGGGEPRPERSDGTAPAGPLVVMGNNSAAHTETHLTSGSNETGLAGLGPSLKRLLADRARALIAETCGDMGEADKVRACGVNVTAGLSDVAVEKSPQGHAFTSGLQTCGSVWACPICSFKIRTKRAAELATAIAVHKANGGSVLLLTLTTQHSHGEPLDVVWDTVQECWAYVTSHSRYRRLRDHHRMGFVRSTEVMHGRNGWHPHLHILLFVDGTVGPFDRRDEYNNIAHVFHELWVHRMKSKYDRDVKSSIGVDLRPVKTDDAEGVGTYCTKAGYEVAMADGKEGRTRTSRHPFALAYDAVETGDKESIDLFRDWVKGSHNRQMWSWSKGLRQELGLAKEKTDEELASEADETIGRVCTISKSLWRQIVITRVGLRARFLAALDIGVDGLDTAIGVLEHHGLTVTVEQRSPGDPPRLAGPGEQQPTAGTFPAPIKGTNNTCLKI